MNRDTTQKIATGVIFFFIAIALITQLITHPLATIGLLAIIVVVILLYKYPPQWLINWTSQTTKPATKAKKRKRYPFRVINGKKKSS